MQKTFSLNNLWKQAALAAALLALIGSMLACSSSTQIMSINLDGEAFKAPLQKALQSQGLAFEIQQIDIQEQSLHVSGDFTPVAGQSTAGSFDVFLKVEDEALKVEVGALNFPGQTLEEDAAARLAEHTAKEVRRSLAEGRGEIGFVEIKTRPQALQMVIRILPEDASAQP